jgi:enoyl-CoA hydratase
MKNQAVFYEKRNQTAWIYLDRPKEMNAISKTLLIELAEFFKKSELDEQIKLAVLTGNGRAFCAGADLKELLEDLQCGNREEPGLLDLCEGIRLSSTGYC